MKVTKRSQKTKVYGVLPKPGDLVPADGLEYIPELKEPPNAFRDGAIEKRRFDLKEHQVLVSIAVEGGDERLGQLVLHTQLEGPTGREGAAPGATTPNSPAPAPSTGTGAAVSTKRQAMHTQCVKNHNSLCMDVSRWFKENVLDVLFAESVEAQTTCEAAPHPEFPFELQVEAIMGQLVEPSQEAKVGPGPERIARPGRVVDIPVGPTVGPGARAATGGGPGS